MAPPEVSAGDVSTLGTGIVASGGWESRHRHVPGFYALSVTGRAFTRSLSPGKERGGSAEDR